MDRHPRRHGRPPGGIGAGVEIALELHPAEPAVPRCADPHAHVGRVALGGGLHRLGPRIGHAARAGPSSARPAPDRAAPRGRASSRTRPRPPSARSGCGRAAWQGSRPCFPDPSPGPACRRGSPPARHGPRHSLPPARYRHVRRSPLRNRPSTTTSARASAAPASPHETKPPHITLRSLPGCSCGASVAQRLGHLAHVGQRLPVHREAGRIEAPPSRSRVPTTAATASPRKRVSLSAKTGWSTKAGITPKAFRPGTSRAVSVQTMPGRPLRPRLQIAQRESRARIGRADHADHQRIGAGPRHPRTAPSPPASPHRPPGAPTCRQRPRPCGRRPARACGHHRVDDLAVARAAAEHAAQRILHLRRIGPGHRDAAAPRRRPSCPACRSRIAPPDGPGNCPTGAAPAGRRCRPATVSTTCPSA